MQRASGHLVTSVSFCLAAAAPCEEGNCKNRLRLLLRGLRRPLNVRLAV